MPSNDELHRWIAESRQHRQHLKAGVAISFVVALLASFIDGRAAGVILVLTAVVAVSGFWIIAGHIADWEAKLARSRIPSTRPIRTSQASH